MRVSLLFCSLLLVFLKHHGNHSVVVAASLACLIIAAVSDPGRWGQSLLGIQ